MNSYYNSIYSSFNILNLTSGIHRVMWRVFNRYRLGLSGYRFNTCISYNIKENKIK